MSQWTEKLLRICSNKYLMMVHFYFDVVEQISIYMPYLSGIGITFLYSVMGLSIETLKL